MDNRLPGIAPALPADTAGSSTVSEDHVAAPHGRSAGTVLDAGAPKAPYMHVIDALASKPFSLEQQAEINDYAELMKCHHKDLDAIHEAAELACFSIIANCSIPDLAPVDHHHQLVAQIPDSPLQASVKHKFFTAMRSMQNSDLPKKQRGNLPKEAVEEFRRWFDAHRSHPYPTEEDKKMLSDQTGVEVNQITNWFINFRKRVWKPTLPESHPMKGSSSFHSNMQFE